MKFLHPNVPLLSLCVCLTSSATALIITTSALVGFALAEDKSFATLPLATQFVAIMCTSIPAAMLMQKIGRKPAFMLSTAFGMAGGCLATFAILQGNFWLFAVGTTLIGIFHGFANYFRFAAADSVDVPYKSRAVSYVMLGGVAAAVIGPTLARSSKDWLNSAEFAGSYAAVIALYGLILVVLSFLRIEEGQGKSAAAVQEPPRDLGVIVRQPRYVVAVICGMLGYGVMAFVMTATPLAMDQMTYVFDQTAIVIQWHSLAMFAPSFVTGSLIARFGVQPVMMTGVMFGFASVAINLAGTGFEHFLFGLICLGLSWNFMFVGATTLITDTYTLAEKNKAQAVNDFLIFTSVALATLSAGALQNLFGWRMVNIGVVPLLLLALCSLVWLRFRSVEDNAPLARI